MPDDPHSRSPHPDSSWTPPRRSPWPFRFGVLVLLTALVASLFTPLGQRAGRAASRRLFPPGPDAAPRVIVREKVVEKLVEVPVPAPPPALPSGPSLSPRGGDLTTLFGGVGFKTTFLPSEGETATAERADEAAYVVEMNLKLRLPKPATTLDQLRPLNPGLPRLLPGLTALVERGKVSGFFHYLYDLKAKSVIANLKRLDRLPTRHNFYDLDALLECEEAATKQKVLFMQADMDVVSDGSDGDRMPSFDDYILKSSHFQPTTSYGWPKTTPKQNPVIPKLEEELREVREKLKSTKLTKEEKTALTARAEEIPRLTADLKRRSYLIGQEDPFIVIPSSLRNYKGRNDWAPSIGDYAVVIHGNLLLPAVVGDYGPTTKVGEASLRIARQIDAKASPYRRPVSDLKVTYLIFPDSADTDRKAPDYAAWRTKCLELLVRIGGLGGTAVLHEWEDRLRPPPPPPSPATPAAAADAAPDAVAPPADPAVPAPAEPAAPASPSVAAPAGP
jgi:hypothetical protein